jgi:site-specific DNA-cytosine methylase
MPLTKNQTLAIVFAKTHKPMSEEDAEKWQPVKTSPTITHWPRDRSDTGTDVAVMQPIALADISSRDKTQNGAGWKDDGTMYTLDTTGLQGVAQSMQVRRLTPRECERLQGFFDDYTAIPYRGKPASDGPRYKALGNSMAVPVMAWIGKRIQMVEDLE